MRERQACAGQYPPRVVERPAIREVDQDHSMILKGTPNIGEEAGGGQLRRHPGTDECVDDHQVHGPVAQLCDAADTVYATNLDPTTSRQRQVPTDEGGELDVRPE